MVRSDERVFEIPVLSSDLQLHAWQWDHSSEILSFGACNTSYPSVASDLFLLDIYTCLVVSLITPSPITDHDIWLRVVAPTHGLLGISFVGFDYALQSLELPYNSQAEGVRDSVFGIGTGNAQAAGEDWQNGASGSRVR